MPANSTFESALQDLHDARDDLRKGGFERTQGGFRRIVSILDAEPLASLVRSYLRPFDFSGWWTEGAGKSHSMSGQPQLPWPDALEERVAAQIAFCRHAATDKTVVPEYMYRVIGTGPGNLDQRHNEIVDRTVDNLIRDLSRLADRRIMPPVLDAALQEQYQESGDADLDRLLRDAQAKFRDSNPVVRKEGLERLWDAFERMKTLLDSTDKARSATQLLDLTAQQPAFRALLRAESTSLTDIGNRFHIRHFETNRAPIDDPRHVDYLFHRCFAFVHLCLSASRQHV
jgi:hypothetical protein